VPLRQLVEAVELSHIRTELQLTRFFLLLEFFFKLLTPNYGAMSGQGQGSVRKRKGDPIAVKAKDASSTGIAAPRDDELDALVGANLGQKPGAEWDYRIALVAITVLAFVTRFWGISHPNEVVFDEVHFGKVSFSQPPRRSNRFANAQLIVCLILSRTNLFLRCSPSFRQAFICVDGLVCWI
jgi:hypothetical protein